MVLYVFHMILYSFYMILYDFYMILYGFYMILYDFYMILYGFYMILYGFYMILYGFIWFFEVGPQFSNDPFFLTINVWPDFERSTGNSNLRPEIRTFDRK